MRLFSSANSEPSNAELTVPVYYILTYGRHAFLTSGTERLNIQVDDSPNIVKLNLRLDPIMTLSARWGPYLVLASFLSTTASTAPPSMEAIGLPPDRIPNHGAGTPFIDKLAGIDKNRWSISHGWTNGPYMVNDWQKSQVRLEKGVILELSKNTAAPRGYSSGEIQSNSEYGYGYFETIMQAARGSGIISGFFTYTGPYFKKQWHEIDIEIIGSNTRNLYLSYFYNGKKKTRVIELEFDAAASPHHFSFDWQPQYIRWYVDGRLVHQAAGDGLPLPNQTQKIMMHLWGTDKIPEWAGPFDAKAIPARMLIECVGYSRTRPARDKCLTD